jgi:hypothetical protein
MSAIRLTGDGPGTPSEPELVDLALAQPEFRAWVEQAPDLRWSAYGGIRMPRRSGYMGYYAGEAGIAGVAPNGWAEYILTAGTPDSPLVDGYGFIDPAGAVFFDAWSGAFLGTWFGTTRGP